MSRWRRFLRWMGVGCWDCGRRRFGHHPFCKECLAAHMEAVVREWAADGWEGRL